MNNQIISAFLLSTFLSISANILAFTQASEQGFHAAASLIYHAYSLIDDIEDKHNPDSTDFSDEELSSLWKKVAGDLEPLAFLKAYDNYNHARNCMSANLKQQACADLNSLISILRDLSEDPPITLPPAYVHKKVSDSDQLKNNPYLSNKAKKSIAPYLIPSDWPLKQFLDGIFLYTRATTNDWTLLNSGFHILSVQPRSFIRILRHPLLPNYLLKAYVDAELQVKKNLNSWEWFVKRCQGASNIRKIIKNKKIKLFTVPNKWIYVFPENPAPPNDAYHKRHLAILVVEDMHLTSFENCLYAWYNQITPSHLNELYQIISSAKGSSYRPDNIALTVYGTFAFIDTEYPKHSPDYDSIKHFLSPVMCNYWNKLIKNGGS